MSLFVDLPAYAEIVSVSKVDLLAREKRIQDLLEANNGLVDELRKARAAGGMWFLNAAQARTLLGEIASHQVPPAPAVVSTDWVVRASAFLSDSFT